MRKYQAFVEKKGSLEEKKWFLALDACCYFNINPFSFSIFHFPFSPFIVLDIFTYIFFPTICAKYYTKWTCHKCVFSFFCAFSSFSLLFFSCCIFHMLRSQSDNKKKQLKKVNKLKWSKEWEWEKTTKYIWNLYNVCGKNKRRHSPTICVAFLWRCWIADETVDTTEYFYTNIQNMRNKKPNLRYVRQHEQHKEGWASNMYIKKSEYTSWKR